jgi:alpha-1,3-rhamnosyl/mannosyltransferase
MAILGRRGGDAVLIVAGEPGPETAALAARAASLGLSGRVRMTGYLPRADLIALYRAAAALVYPSLHEGFGLPVLEAMAAGKAVLTSDREPLRGLAGDAAVLVDPADEEAIAAGIRRVAGDGALRATLAQRAVARARGYTWHACAAATRRAYEAVVSLPS